MKAAAYSPVLVPALVLCAALTAASDGAGAGEEPLVLFPGAAADGGGKTAEPPPLGANAASPVAEPARPAEIGAPQNWTHETQADTPAGGSRLLRVLAGTPKTPTSTDDGAAGSVPLSGPRVSGTSVFAAEGCPRALLQRLLAGAAGEADALSALGIEREILALCRERQEILVGLFEAEAALRELSAPPPVPAPVTRTSEAVAPAPAKQRVAAIRPAAPSPLRAALASTAAREKETEPQVPRYAWFSVIGSAGALRAGVTDGSGVWFVREGDALPGGARIAAIAGRPPAVLVTGSGETLVPEIGEATPLPYRAWPGDAP